MKQRLEFLVETQMETGTTPKKTLENNPELARAVKVNNRMEKGLYTIHDLTYKELVLAEFVDTVTSKKQREKIRRQQKQMQAENTGF